MWNIIVNTLDKESRYVTMEQKGKQNAKRIPRIEKYA
jgi:hypothetical protein